jgi:hypothetical protein
MDDSSCAICTEPLAAKLAATVCGHIFHEHCLARWLTVVPARKRACPQCRTDLPRTTSIRCLRPRDFTCAPLAAELTLGARGVEENADAEEEDGRRSHTFSLAELAALPPADDDGRSAALLEAQLRATEAAAARLREAAVAAARGREALSGQKRALERRILETNDTIRRLRRTPPPPPPAVAPPATPPVEAGSRAPNEKEREYLVTQLRSLERLRSEKSRVAKANRESERALVRRRAEVEALRKKLDAAGPPGSGSQSARNESDGDIANTAQPGDERDLVLS